MRTRFLLLLIPLTAAVLVVSGCGASGDDAADTTLAANTTAVEATTTTVATTTTTSRATQPAAATTQPAAATTTVAGATAVDKGLVYHSDAEGDWTADVFYPTGDGPWPLVVVLPPGMSVDYVGEQLAERGVVAVVADSWTIVGWVDPAPHLYGEMDRAACVVGWAQAHAVDYNADPESTTVDGYSGGAMAAAWAGLGLADDSMCDYPISTLPVGLVVGESQFLFQHERWDDSFASGDPEPLATVDGFFNADRWNVSPDLQVALWSAVYPIAETRAVENPPNADSWMWLREAATPVVDDLTLLGALDDERIAFVRQRSAHGTTNATSRRQCPERRLRHRAPLHRGGLRPDHVNPTLTGNPPGSPAHIGTCARRLHESTVVAGDWRFGRMRAAAYLHVSRAVASKCPGR